MDEDFAVESMVGDIFLLGTTSGAFAAWSRAASGWKTRAVPHPRFLFGAGKRRAGRRSFRSRCRDCARTS